MDFSSILERFVEETAGKDAVKLFHLLKERENISEFILAEDLKITVNQVRNLLYKLNSFNLVYSNRKKDKEKGLYIYYWTFNFKHARDVLVMRKNNELRHLKEELIKQNEQRFYICKNDNSKFELEEAMEMEFKCPECGALLHQEDSTKRIAEINHKIPILMQELEELKKPVMIIPKPEEEEKVKKPRKAKRKGKKKKKGKKAKKKKAKKAKKKSKNKKKAKKIKSKKKHKKRVKKIKAKKHKRK
ncbi:MAG: hypothetical protein AABW45_02820 [Nanoarchaeota archaeon]